MAKMDDASLLTLLQAWEEDSAEYVLGELAEEREQALAEYNREPYGNEEPGWSSIVTSDIQDTIESVLPDLIDVFASTDKAVVFDPTRAEDVEGAEQATDTVNYVFYKQNDGFLTLYTALKDALQIKSCAVMWRTETKRTKTITPVRGATAEMLAMQLHQTGGELEAAEEVPQQPVVDAATGQMVTMPPIYNARIRVIEERKVIKVEAFHPNDLLVYRDWTSPLLADCPYVCRVMKVTLSDVHEMGFTDVTADDLRASDESGLAGAYSFRGSRNALERDRSAEITESDATQTEGYLRIEFVLADVDGDGIAERRMVLRLEDKILSNEECSHVQIATASPLLVTHQWAGKGLWDLLSDLQKLNSELTRQTLNSAYLATNPRKTILTDAQGTPYANIDDLLDNRPGGVLRQQKADAIGTDITPFVGHQMLPLLEHVDQMRESRTGVSMQAQGLDPNAINERTATAARLANGAAQKRIKLMARIFAEILLKPIFQGVLKLLTDGDMEKIAFRLRNKFVEYDPNEWRDGYDMTVNVGLGTGDKEMQAMQLQQIAANQAAIAASPFAPMLLTPKTLYNVFAKQVEAAGFKDTSQFWVDPGDHPMPQPAPPPPDPKIQIEQMRQQADAQKFQAETQRLREADERAAAVKLQEVQANLELQAANDQRDAEREALKAQYAAEQALRDDETKRLTAQLAAETTRYTTDANNAVKLQIAGMTQAGKAGEEGEGASPGVDMSQVLEAIEEMRAHIAAPTEIVRDASGRAIGVKRGEVTREIARGPDGRASGVM